MVVVRAASKIDEYVITPMLWRRAVSRRDVSEEIRAFRFLRDSLMGDPRDCLHSAPRVALWLCSANGAGLSLSDAPRRVPCFRTASRVAAGDEQAPETPPAVPEPFLTPCVSGGEPMLVKGWTPEGLPTSDEILLAPIPAVAGNSGVIWVSAKAGQHHFDRYDACVLDHVGDFVAVALEMAARAKASKEAEISRELWVSELAFRVRSTLQM
jgi:hypothetical protein